MDHKDDNYTTNKSDNNVVQIKGIRNNHEKIHATLNADEKSGDGLATPDSTTKVMFPGLSEEPVLYTRRWFMAFLFAFYSASSAFQWIHLNIIGDKVLLFYEPSMPASEADKAIAIDWLSMVYMLGYMICMLPASWILDRRGLYVVGVVGTLLNCLGAWIKCVSIHPDRFAVLMLGQCICSVAQAFILGVPARLAAVWFGPNEVSTATAIGVFGNQIGCALGFLIPPMVVNTPANCFSINSTKSSLLSSNTNLSSPASHITPFLKQASTSNLPSTQIACDDLDHLTYKFRLLFFGGAIVTSALFFLVVFFFRKRPISPPSRAQMVASLQSSAEGNSLQKYTASLYRLVTNVPFFLLFITYGINVGSYYAIGTLLNPIILFYFPSEHMKAGWVGLTLVVAGVIGSIFSGLWLDRTKLFKSTTLAIYCLSCLGMLAFALVLHTGNMNLVFTCAFLMGFFMTGYLPVGFEFAAEITFPESEGTSSGLLNGSAQVFGISFTMIVRAMDTVFLGNMLIVSFLFVGSVVTAFINAELKRQKAHQRISSLCVIQTITATSPDSPS